MTIADAVVLNRVANNRIKSTVLTMFSVVNTLFKGLGKKMQSADIMLIARNMAETSSEVEALLAMVKWLLAKKSFKPIEKKVNNRIEVITNRLPEDILLNI